MTKKIILSSLLFIPILFSTGCMNSSQPIPIVTTTNSTAIIAEIHTNSNTLSTIKENQNEGRVRNMKTVQGDTIIVNEYNRGFDFPQYQGKIVLVQIFGKECQYCFEEIPTINKIQNAYRDKLSVIAIQGQPPMSKEKAFELIREHQMNYPIIDQDEAKSILVFLRDVYNWRGILPYIMLIKNGQIEQVFQGAGKSFEEISEGINEIQ